MENMKTKLSTLWVLVMFNYLYADVIGFFEPGMIEQIIAGDLGGLQMTPAFLLGSAILMEIPIVMVFLSRTLKNKANRWANIITGTIYTGVILSTMSFFGAPPPYYLFFGTVEIVITALIVWYAWKWPKQEGWAAA